jgi:hypothetical protein
MNDLWRPTREWEGEVAFIVAGGPSVLTQDLELLRGRKVIAINASHQAVPWAEFVVVADARFFWHYRPQLMEFQGRVISACMSIAGPPKIHRMHRKATLGLATEGGTLAIKATTLTAAINLAVHLGARAIVLLGADGRVAADGKVHHHADHPWRQLNGCWDKQKADLKAIADDLLKLGIPCLNASPGSALSFWPVMELPEAIAKLDDEASAANYRDVGDRRQPASASSAAPPG